MLAFLAQYYEQEAPARAAGASIAVFLILFLVLWVGLAFIPVIIVRNKGYASDAVLGMVILSFFLSWLVALVVALILPDKRANAPIYPQRRFGRGRVMDVPGRSRARFGRPQPEIETPQAQQLPAGFVQCPRCGQQNNSALTACWNCKLPFQSALVLPAPPPQPAVAPPVVAPAPYAAPMPAPVNVEQSMGADASVQMAEFSTQAVEPVKADPRKASGIKVRCRSCQKKFSGEEDKLLQLGACPRCQTVPFAFDVIGPA